MRYEGRFVVDPHMHITTLYKPLGVTEGWDFPNRGANAEVEPFDNSAFTLYEMARYGIDMGVLLPSFIGTTNEMQAKLVDKYPDKFRACCADQLLKRAVHRGEAKWTVEAAAEEVENALKTGKFVGIGEFIPRNPDPKHIYTFKERLDETCLFADLAAKYKVALQWHDFILRYGWAPIDILYRIAEEYRDVPIVFSHAGHSIGSYAEGADLIRKACGVAGRAENIYLETGTWCAEYYQIALKNPNVGATQLIWTGGDYGNVPQIITSHPGQEPSGYGTTMKRMRRVPSYQTDWWGWGLQQIRKIKDWVTQDEINLIVGGNAAKVYKLPVPFERMFPEGRPDLYGINWKDSVPFLPKDQIQHPDYQ